MRIAKLSTLGLPAFLLLGLASEAHADARADVLAAFEAAMAKKSYRAVAVSDHKGKRTESVIQMQMPSSFHLKTEGSEVIVLPGATWMNANGQWMKLPMDMSKMIEGISLEAMKEGANLVKDVRELGTETIDGCNATNYAYRTDGRVMGMDASADVELAVCNGLPLRVSSVDPKGKSRTTITYDYETPVVIRAPN